MAVHIEVTGGPLTGTKFNFEEPESFIFGRGDKVNCQIVDDPGVSRFHFLIEARPPLARLQDLGSTNGVYVNEVKYGGRAPGAVMETDLNHGDVIRVGRSTMCFTVDGAGGPAMEPPAGRRVADGIPGPGRSGGFSSIINVAADGSERAGPPDIPGYGDFAPIGKGSMGVVYRAARLEDGRPVAVKLVKASGKTGEAVWGRFSREIEITKSFRHPNVVEFIDAGKLDHELYLIIEFMAGGDLSRMLKKLPGPMPLADAVSVMRQVLAGMAEAHRNDIVHRDIKPANVLFLDPEATVAKISDLGLAKRIADESSFTVTGSGGGTPSYMAPEQVTQLRHAKPVSDVFSLAATFYELLTRKPAYNFSKGKNFMSTILAGDIVPLEDRIQDLSDPLPPPLMELIMRGLSTIQEDRFPDAGAMLEALEALDI